VLAQFVTTGHRPCTPRVLVAQKTGCEQKIIFRNYIPGKKENINRLKIALKQRLKHAESGKKGAVLPCRE
jgi:hypothetical protein